MKKVKKEYIKYYPFLRLYKKDIEEIIKLFKQNCKSVEIYIDEYKLDDISEIKDIDKQKVSYFHISSTLQAYLSLSSKSANFVLINEDDLKLRGLETKIDQIFAGRKSAWDILNSPWVFIPHIIITVCVIIWWLSSLTFLSLSLTFLASTVGVMILGFFPLCISYLLKYIDSNKHCVIFLCNPEERSNFFKRNKDRLIIGLIGAFVGGIITFIITCLTPMLRK